MNLRRFCRILIFLSFLSLPAAFGADTERPSESNPYPVTVVMDDFKFELDDKYRVILQGLAYPDPAETGIFLEDMKRQVRRFMYDYVKENPVWVRFDRSPRAVKESSDGSFFVYLRTGAREKLNEELLKQGLAVVRDDHEFDEKRPFERLEQAARRRRVGFWAEK